MCLVSGQLAQLVRVDSSYTKGVSSATPQSPSSIWSVRCCVVQLWRHQLTLHSLPRHLHTCKQMCDAHSSLKFCYEMSFVLLIFLCLCRRQCYTIADVKVSGWWCFPGVVWKRIRIEAHIHVKSVDTILLAVRPVYLCTKNLVCLEPFETWVSCKWKIMCPFNSASLTQMMMVAMQMHGHNKPPVKHSRLALTLYRACHECYHQDHERTHRCVEYHHGIHRPEENSWLTRWELRARVVDFRRKIKCWCTWSWNSIRELFGPRPLVGNVKCFQLRVWMTKGMYDSCTSWLSYW